VSERWHVLLHTCCAVCLEAVLPALCEEGWAVTAFFFNPNIHPYREFEKRLRAVEVAAEMEKVTLVAENLYGLQTYLDHILPYGARRCRACYDLRLEVTAEEAADGGYDAFTTTLLASGHQAHADVKAAGEEAARKYGVEFLYRDWRDRLEAGKEAARRKSLYTQQYCGCIWSEYERFAPRSENVGT